MGSQDARPPRVPPHQGCGDHHRPAGPGPGLRGRHGDGVALRARPVRPRRRRRAQPVRPLHLRDRLRRRHGGGRDQRGVLAGRHPAARQPHRVLRPQPDLDRGRHRHRALRGRPGALPRLRLARPGGRGRRERRRHRRGHRRGQGGHRQAVVHRGAHDHRLPGPHQDEHRRRARRRRSATTRWPPPRRCSASTRTRRSRCATRSSRTPASWWTAARKPTRSGSRVRRVGASANPSARSCWTGCWPRNCPTAGTPT